MMRFLLLLLTALGTLTAVPVLVVLVLLATTPITLVGFLYLLGCLLIASGLLSVPWWRRRSAILIVLGTSLILGTIGIRVLVPPSGAQLVLRTLPPPSAPRVWNRVFNEQDIVLFGARLALTMHLISPAEDDGLAPALAAQYQAMQDVTPISPFLLTYLNQQRPDGFDALIAEPPANPKPKRGIIFLHGYGGNFTLECWLMAHVGNQLGALTICPSTGPIGDWWSVAGEATFDTTLRYLQQRGIERSIWPACPMGGIGASRLVHRFDADLAGLI